MKCFDGMRLFFLNGLVLPTGIITEAPKAGSPKSEVASEVPTPPVKSWSGVFCEQLINSFLVAAFTGLSTWGAGTNGDVSGKAAGIAFGLTFIVEMRKYRKV